MKTFPYNTVLIKVKVDVNLASQVEVPASTYKGGVFLHLVVNGMRWGEAAQPEALLTHAVVVALLTLVAQPGEVLPAAAVTGGLVDN